MLRQDLNYCLFYCNCNYNDLNNILQYYFVPKLHNNRIITNIYRTPFKYTLKTGQYLEVLAPRK